MSTSKLLPALVVGLISLLSAGCASPGDRAVKPYPLSTCIVTENALGSMGDPVTRVYQGQEVKFCCDPCIAIFEEHPDLYLEKLNAATRSE